MENQNKELNEIHRVIELLPPQLKSQIYNDCNKSLNLHNKISDYLRLGDNDGMTQILPEIFSNYIIVKHLHKNDKNFKELYTDYRKLKKNHPNDFEQYFVSLWLELHGK